MKYLIVLLLFLAVNCFAQTAVPPDFKKTSVKIDETRYDLYKGAILVPMDHSDLSAGFIDLPVQIIRSHAPTSAVPVYWFSGGPGSSNLDFIPAGEFMENHDFILVGYRGIDGSPLKKSRKLNKALRGTGNELLSGNSIDNLGMAAAQYLSELAKEHSGLEVKYWELKFVPGKC